MTASRVADPRAHSKKDPYDRTQSKRASSYLERLNASKGRRLPVDLSGDHNAKLNALLESGYAKTAADVIRNALDEAYERSQEKS